MTVTKQRTYAVSHSPVSHIVVREPYTVTHHARPPTTNAVQRMHHMERAALASEWRHAFASLARVGRVPRMHGVAVVVAVSLTGKRGRDIDSSSYAVKWAIDGLVDAGVLADDGPGHIASLTYRQPLFGQPGDSLSLTIEEA